MKRNGTCLGWAVIAGLLWAGCGPDAHMPASASSGRQTGTDIRSVMASCPTDPLYSDCDTCIDAPQALDQTGTTYCLARDLTLSDGGFAISVNDVTLDGKGHRITYTRGAHYYNSFLHIDRSCSDSTEHDESCWVRRATVRNFNVEADNIDFVKWIGLNLVSDSLFENTRIIVRNATTDNAPGDGKMLFAFFSSFKNRFLNNYFYFSFAGTVEIPYFFNLRNGSCGNQFVNNTFVAASPSIPFILRPNSGSTGNWGRPQDNVFSGNRFFMAGDNALNIQASEVNDRTIIENNLFYSMGTNVWLYNDVGGNYTYQVHGNTFLSQAGLGFTRNNTQATGSIDFKNNIFVTGDQTIAVGASVMTSDYNDLLRTTSGPLIENKQTLSDWQEASGKDMNSMSEGSASALFVDPGVDLTVYPPYLGNFQLKVDPPSPAKGKGEFGIDLGAPNGGLAGSLRTPYCSKTDSGPPPTDPVDSTIPHGVIVMGGYYTTDGQFRWADGLGSFSITVRDGQATPEPVPNALVSLDLSACPYIDICSDTPNLSGRVVTGQTDANGNLTLSVIGRYGVDP
ncbi:MAG: hypothetical protein V1798_12205, partial [Pseudomonadota bacterium]